MAITSILGRKVGMTQIWTDKGERVGVTVVEAGPCKVLQVKNDQTDGYFAVQLGFGEKKEKNTTKPLFGHFDKAGTTPKSYVREVRLNAAADEKVGDEIKATVLEGIKYVDVTGTSKGKGYQGVMKRHNFRGLPASHGCSKRHRAPGGLGRTYSINKGVPKGKRMAGHMGSVRVTIQALELVKIDAENNILLIKGAVPGANGTYLQIAKGLKEKVVADAVAKGHIKK
jgi:large subunit ribosomal protein L3